MKAVGSVELPQEAFLTILEGRLMRAASLDRRVKKEASLLVREARTALGLKRGLRGKAGDLETVTSDVERGLADGDLARVRGQLAVLDSLVDELVKRAPKSSDARLHRVDRRRRLDRAGAARVRDRGVQDPSSSMYRDARDRRSTSSSTSSSTACASRGRARSCSSCAARGAAR